MSKGVELQTQCDSILRSEPHGLLFWVTSTSVQAGWDVFAHKVAGAIGKLSEFIHGVCGSSFGLEKPVAWNEEQNLRHNSNPEIDEQTGSRTFF